MAKQKKTTPATVKARRGRRPKAEYTPQTLPADGRAELHRLADETLLSATEITAKLSQSGFPMMSNTVGRYVSARRKKRGVLIRRGRGRVRGDWIDLTAQAFLMGLSMILTGKSVQRVTARMAALASGLSPNADGAASEAAS